MLTIRPLKPSMGGIN